MAGTFITSRGNEQAITNLQNGRLYMTTGTVLLIHFHVPAPRLIHYLLWRALALWQVCFRN